MSFSRFSINRRPFPEFLKTTTYSEAFYYQEIIHRPFIQIFHGPSLEEIISQAFFKKTPKIYSIEKIFPGFPEAKNLSPSSNIHFSGLLLTEDHSLFFCGNKVYHRSYIVKVFY